MAIIGRHPKPIEIHSVSYICHIMGYINWQQKFFAKTSPIETLNYV
jgi:hypothetical protein